MNEVLIALFVLINIFIVVKYYRYDFGVFQAPFLAAAGSIAVFLPQLTSYYISDYYDNDLLPNLLIVMCTCNIAFAVGFGLGKKKNMPAVIRDLDLVKVKPVLVVLSLAGIFAGFSLRGVYMNEMDAESSAKSNFIVMVNLAYYMELGFIYCLVYLRKLGKYDKIIIAIILVASFVMLEAAISMGRRNLTLRFLLNVLLVVALIKPKSFKYIKVFLISVFLFGSILNASIETIRTNLAGNSNEAIDYTSNLKDSFAQDNFSLGMDIGNAAIGIDYCFTNDDYDYGVSIWNAFIFNFVPRFLVGSELKSSLQVKYDYQNVIPVLTHGTTTMTGYFDAFASFSYFGFIKFLFLGYILGVLWTRSSQSSLHMIVYMFIFTQVTSIFTHNTAYIFMRLEFIFLFFFPVIAFYIHKYKRQNSNYTTL